MNSEASELHLGKASGMCECLDCPLHLLENITSENDVIIVGFLKDQPKDHSALEFFYLVPRCG
jgi:hypothetical protein